MLWFQRWHPIQLKLFRIPRLISLPINDKRLLHNSDNGHGQQRTQDAETFDAGKYGEDDEDGVNPDRMA